jgi:hypothetical protein
MKTLLLPLAVVLIAASGFALAQTTLPPATGSSVNPPADKLPPASGSSVKPPADSGILKSPDSSMKVPSDPGIVTTPPKVDPKAVKTPPRNIDPKIDDATENIDRKNRRKSADKTKSP